MLSGTALVIPVEFAVAQSASEVTPDSFQPQLRKLGGAISFPGLPGTKAPPGSEKIGITLSGVRLEGSFPQMSKANAALRKRLTRGRIPVSEMFNAVADLEAAYADAGYVLSRVVLPKQTLRDGGVLRIEVVDGFVESVDTSQVPPEVRRRFEALVKPLVDRKGMTMAELERQLLLAGDVSGVALGSALSIGQRPGGTVIVLDPKFRSVTGFVGFDNFTSKKLGGFALQAGFELNGLLRFGETIYGRISASPYEVFSSDPRYRVLGAGAVLPLGPSGLVANAEVTMSDITPANSAIPTRSDFDRQSLRLVYPWVRSRKINLSSQFILDRSKDKQVIKSSGAPVFLDRLTVLRGGVNLSYSHDDNAFTSAGLILSRGVDILGARTASEVSGGTPLSREGADALFTKLTGSVSHQRSIGKKYALSTTGRFQLAFGEPLLTSEQFGIVGSGELSTFDSGALRGDSGWVVRSEFSRAQQVKVGRIPLTLSPYVFAGVGGVAVHNATAVETPYEAAYSFGGGVDVISQTGSRFRSNSLRVEFGKGGRNNGPDDTRFSISGNFRF